MALRFLLCLGLLLQGAAAAAPARAESELFPRPPAIQPRIEFWTRVYTEVGTEGGLIHDSRNLGVVYEVLRLPEGLSSRARERRIDKAREGYERILKKLATGRRSGLSSEEQRVLALFPPKVTAETLRVSSRRVRFQLGQADKFRAGLRRMGRWERFIRQVLMERGLPVELVALPHVESSYNPRAYSHAGASGLWQFTRSTGRRYMRVDHVLDERRDPFLATVAAARLLKENYKSTRTWPLAITSYNHGAAGMRRAVRKLGTRDIDRILEQYKSRSFGFASQNFYTEFLAALDVELNPERYFGPITKDPEEDPEIVPLDHFYTTSTLSKTLGVSVEILQAHNPALMKPVWAGQKRVPANYGLRLPRSVGRPAASTLLASIGGSERHSDQIVDRRYRVRRGDTLGKIARRFGVSQTALMRANRLRNRNRIHIGQQLEIPGRSQAKTQTAQAPRRTQPEPLPASGVYRVRKGDNLASVGRRFGVTQADLIALNKLRNRNHIVVGQLLQIPGGSRTATAASAETGSSSSGVYRVRKGDNLESIARRFKVSQQSIVKLNELRSRHRIRVGQLLYIPGAGPASAPASPTLSRAETPSAKSAASEPATRAAQPVVPAPDQAAPPPPEAAPPAPASPAPSVLPGVAELPLRPERYAVAADGSIEVQPGETLGHYAEWLETSARALRQHNSLRPGRPLRLGSRLRIDSSPGSTESFERRRQAHHRELQARFYQSYEVSGTRTYVLKRGDTVWKLSQGDETLPVWLLRAYNPELDFSSLRAGQRVTIPRVVPRPS